MFDFSEVKHLYFVTYKLKCTDNFLMGPRTSINLLDTEIIPMSGHFKDFV